MKRITFHVYRFDRAAMAPKVFHYLGWCTAEHAPEAEKLAYQWWPVEKRDIVVRSEALKFPESMLIEGKKS